MSETNNDQFDRYEGRELPEWVTYSHNLIDALGDLIDITIKGFTMLLGSVPTVLMILSGLAFVHTFGASGNWEILLGLVAAEAIALYISHKFEHTPLTDFGDMARNAVPYFGMFNTLFSFSLVLVGKDFYPQAALFLPLAFSGFALTCYFIVYNQQYSTVLEKKILRAKGENRLQATEQRGRAELAKQASRDAMVQSRLELQQTAYSELAKDGRIMELQKRAVYVTFVKEMMTAAGIHPNSKEGKEILEIARQAAKGETAPVQHWPVDTNGTEYIPLHEGNNLPN